MRIYFMVLAALAGASCAPRQESARAPGGRPLPPQPAFQRQIRNAVDAGDGDYHLRLLRDRLAAEPGNLQTRLDLAQAYRKTGFPDVALEHYRLASERFPGSEVAALELAKALRAAGLRQQAAAGLEAFLAANPGRRSPELLSWLGIVRDSMGQWTEGEKAHREALALSPGSDWLHNNLGFNLLKQNRNGEAIEAFRNALARNPASVVARNNLALAFGPAEALEEWKRMYDPATAHSNVAARFIEQGRYAEARTELDAALGYNQSHAAALRNLKVVSELDGGPAVLRARRVETRWSRWLAAARSLFEAPPPGPTPAGGSN
jgi:tetratricopeptide (TPR) repeat protein